MSGLTSTFPLSTGFISINETAGGACCKGKMICLKASLLPKTGIKLAIETLPIV